MVVLGGLSSLQKRANELELVPQQQASYINSFQSGNQVWCWRHTCNITSSSASVFLFTMHILT